MSYLLKFFLFIAFAQGGGDNSPGGGNNTQSIRIENPLGEGATIMTLLSRVIDFVVAVSIPILTLVVLYAAFNMLTAGGDENKFNTGKKTLLYGAIGFAVILVAEGLIKLIEAILVGSV